MKATLCLIGLLLFAQLAFGWIEPDNFRGIKWGMSPEEATRIVSEQLKAKGNDWDHVTDFGDGRLYFQDPFGDIYAGIRVSFTLNFVDGKFTAADLAFKSDHFAEVERIFIKRYGTPNYAKNTPVQNAMGAKFQNRDVAWLGKGVKIRLVKYNDRIGSAAGVVGQTKWFEYWRSGSENRQGMQPSTCEQVRFLTSEEVSLPTNSHR
jgi:hypothetical protein